VSRLREFHYWVHATDPWLDMRERYGYEGYMGGFVAGQRKQARQHESVYMDTCARDGRAHNRERAHDRDNSVVDGSHLPTAQPSSSHPFTLCV
jgi:hypothetical protein